jgi:hypothetical protein
MAALTKIEGPFRVDYCQSRLAKTGHEPSVDAGTSHLNC